MPRIKTQKQTLRIARYVRDAVKNEDPLRESLDRGKRLEKAGKLNDDGSVRQTHVDELGL
jgi:hypothetical protein